MLFWVKEKMEYMEGGETKEYSSLEVLERYLASYLRACAWAWLYK